MFPGGVAVSRVSVYDWEAPDGLRGGSPHMHFTCTEGYVVLEGSGSVQTLGTAGFREVSLKPLDVVWFEPGVIHRLVNGNELRLLVVMQNGGLPEAGDAVFAFPLEVLEDAERYAATATVHGEEAVRARRDLAVRGFAELRADPDLLDRFYAAGVARVAEQFDDWEARWNVGAGAAARRTPEILGQLRVGELAPLREGRVYAGHADDTPLRLGMCGRLAVVDWSAAS
jgi:mannose-6-phosphate isomerase-like protein (cupin superfamily)